VEVAVAEELGMAAPARMNSVNKTPASLAGFPFQAATAGIFCRSRASPSFHPPPDPFTGVGGAPSAGGREIYTATAAECWKKMRRSAASTGRTGGECAHAPGSGDGFVGEGARRI